MLKGLGKRYRQGMAFMLAVVMTAVNILAGAGTAYASESEDTRMPEVNYEIDPEALKEAIEGLMGEDGNIKETGITFGELKESYSSVSSSLGDSVVLYPLYVGEPVDSDSIYDTDMLVYYRPGTGETSDAELSGKLDVLFVNHGTKALRFKLTIGEYKNSIVVMGLQIATATPSVGTATPSGPDPAPEATPSGANPPSGSSLGQAAVMEIDLKDLGLAKDSQYKKDIESLLDSVTITDAEGNSVDGTLYVGKKYNITLSFKEEGPQKSQFDFESGTLTYQIPSLFKIDPESANGSLWVKIKNVDYEIGYYSVDENGLMTITISESGKQAVKDIYDVELSFSMQGTAQAVPGGSGGKLHFKDSGTDFTFEVMYESGINVEKEGVFTENETKTGGTLEYTVTTTVESNNIQNAVITDVLTPPQTKALKLTQAEEVNVWLIRGSEEYSLEKSSDYELEWSLVKGDSTEGGSAEGDSTNPYKKQFKVTLKGEYETLSEGDVLEVKYYYNVDYVQGTTDVFWGNVLNEVTVNGTMRVEDPADEGGQSIDVPVEEHRSSNVEIRVSPDGHGVICKTQAFDSVHNTLHYTLYTVVPAGTWTPLYIYDDMYVEYNGKRLYIPEFKEDGRVKNLTVSAVDVENWFNWDETDTNMSSDKIRDLEALKGQAHKLKGFDMNKMNNQNDYDSASLDQYVYLYSDITLFIIFGYDGWEWGNWGNWNYTKDDRLIITEYDLDMSNTFGNEITLEEMTDSTDKEQLTLKPDEVLKAGIMNNVFLRYGGQRPGYSVFFNNNDTINKTGVLDKNTNTIEYTVTINTTDSTVQDYFKGVVKNYNDVVYSPELGYNDWDGAYERSIRAAFYDVLPDGWKYVEGSLYATTVQTGLTSIFRDLSRMTQTIKEGPTDNEGNIYAPLAGFGAEGSTFWLFDVLTNCDINGLRQLSFTYKVQATEEWLDEHATSTTMKAIQIKNHAEITDMEKSPRYSADSTLPYLPAKLTKAAEQVGDTNLVKFTLKVNPYSEDYDASSEFLTVTDTSQNIQIQLDTIQVTNVNTQEIVPFEMLPSEGEGQFKIRVPDSMALTITYDALILEQRAGVQISNTASIDGIDDGESGYQNAFNVSTISGQGSGSSYELTVRKTDSKDNSKDLDGAEFEFYIVLDEDTELSPTDTIIINNKKYDVHKGGTYTTGQDGEEGRFTISGDDLYKGNYYILVETQAPDGYVLPKESATLFYYGLSSDAEKGKYPDAKLALIDGTLTLTNERARGDLEISKTIKIEDPANSFPVAEKTLHFDVEAVENAVTEEEYINGGVELIDLNDTFKLYKEDAEVGTIKFEDGYADVTLTVKADENWQNSVTIKDLPTGYYVVKESQYGVNVANYVWTVDKGFGSYEVTEGSTANVAFTNTYEPNEDERTLRIIKTVRLDGQEDTSVEKEFTFAITGTTVSGDSVSKEVTVAPAGYAEINLKPGHYVITEIGDNKIEGYTFNGVTIEGRPNSWEFDLGAAAGGTDNTITVEAYNNYTRDRGGLTVTKKVEVDGSTDISEEFREKKYTFTITGPEDVNGDYTDSNGGTVTFTEGKAEVVLKAGERITIKDLPTGSYTVTEDQNDAKIGGYTLEVTGETEDSPVVMGRNQIPEVIVTNKYTREVGRLTVTKKVDVKEAVTGAPDITGTVGDMEFVFTIAGKDMTVSGTYKAAKGGTETEVTFTDGSAEVKLKDGESITINGLPTGEYTVTEDWDEAQIDNYTLTVTGGATAENPAAVPKDGEVKVDVANVYNYSQESGSLTVTKALAGDAGDAAAGKEFTFTVTGPSYPEGFTVKIPGAGSETLANLVPGTYTVTEDQEGARINGYTLTVTGEGEAAVTAGATAAVTVTNTYTTPENPTEPENPPEPTNPGGNTPTPPPIENITDEPTPLSSFERLENIEDEDVPLAFMAPMTGDEAPVGAAALFGLIALGMMGAFGILAFRKDDEEA